MTARTLPLTDDDKEAFHAWLKVQPAERVMPAGCMTCPIAEFLRERDGKDWRVSDATVREWNSYKTVYALPAWARAFINRYDWAQRKGRQPTTIVALWALDAVLP